MKRTAPQSARARATVGWREALSGIAPVAVLGTTVCCALPITLVALGLGSVVATLVTTAPWLVALSAHKGWVFLAAGGLLVANYVALYRADPAACQPGHVCHPGSRTGRWLRRTFWATVAVYAAAVFAAYLSYPIASALG